MDHLLTCCAVVRSMLHLTLSIVLSKTFNQFITIMKLHTFNFFYNNINFKSFYLFNNINFSQIFNYSNTSSDFLNLIFGIIIFKNINTTCLLYIQPVFRFLFIAFEILTVRTYLVDFSSLLSKVNKWDR